MKTGNLVIAAIMLILTLSSCKPTDTLTGFVNKPDILVEDVGTNEAWLHFKAGTMQMPCRLVAKTKDSVAINIGISSADTVLCLEGLLPSREYSVEIWNKDLQGSPIWQEKLQTMDTTSHEFSWQSWQIGGVASSWLTGVAIINENDIWAVGDISAESDTGDEYNCVHWDGKEWTKMRIYTYVPPWGRGFARPYNVFKFQNDMVFIGSELTWNGKGFVSWPQSNIDYPGRDRQVWASTEEDIYIVGTEGMILHGKPGQWRQLATGTQTTFSDVYGYTDTKKSLYDVWAVKYGWLAGTTSGLVHIDAEQKITKMPWDEELLLQSIWTVNGRKLYGCGDDISEYKEGQWKRVWLPGGVLQRIRGTGNNNIIAAGDFGGVVHYNGSSWKELRELDGYTKINSLDVQGNLVVLVGERGFNALLMIGRRK